MACRTQNKKPKMDSSSEAQEGPDEHVLHNFDNFCLEKINELGKMTPYSTHLKYTANVIP